GQGGASADVGVQWLRALRYGPDFAGSCLAQVPAFATVDGRYARKLGAWELELAGSNLANRRHYGDAPGCRSSIYLNDARQLRVSARYHF
ncbi:MAG: TonB-dependent receptor, partial [Janthinobacterium sp.]